MENIYEKLIEPFKESEVSWKIITVSADKEKGLVIPYIDCRLIQRRLDSIFGFSGWQASYRAIGSGFICCISIQLQDGTWISKEDGADATDIENIKGGLSSAFKRCAASGYGIGRYLYDIDGQWVRIRPQGKNYVIDEVPRISTSKEIPIESDYRPANISHPTQRQIDFILKSSIPLSSIIDFIKEQYSVAFDVDEKSKILDATKSMNSKDSDVFLLNYILNNKLEKSSVTALIGLIKDKKIS